MQYLNKKKYERDNEEKYKQLSVNKKARANNKTL